MNPKDLPTLIRESKLAIGEYVTHVDDSGDAEPILGFKLGLTRERKNRLHVLLASGEYRAKELCPCPGEMEIEQRAREVREVHFEWKRRQHWNGKVLAREYVAGIKECKLR